MAATLKPAQLLDPAHRGILLDAVVLAANLVALGPLAGWLTGVVRRAAGDDQGAMRVIFVLAILLFVLPPVGATLKRWHYHRRREGGEARELNGCLFNPIFYFCLVVVIFSAIQAFITQQAYGREPPGAVFAVTMVAGLALMLTHTWLVYRYFSRPKAPPRSAFLRGRTAELIGDACLFTNMLLFQTLWAMITFEGIGAPGGIVEAVGRLLVFGFLALLLYFPPRMFYLAEDIGRRGTWVWIGAANLPVVLRLMGW